MPRTPRWSFVAVALSALSAASAVSAADATGSTTPAAGTHQPFGTTADGKPVEIYTLTNPSGVSVSVLTYGAILNRVQLPDRTGKVGDVLLGYGSVAQYEKDSGPFFGALVGRVANRIAKATFTVDGTTYHTPVNNGPNTLHGGPAGFDKRVWTAEDVTGDDGQAVKLSLVDPDGTAGFPGTVHASVTYTLTDAGVLRLTYEATTDKATPINLTSHGYWNLRDGGKSDVKGELMQWQADKYLPVDAVQIPTGQLAPVAGTPFDFRTTKPIGRDLTATGGTPPGYDHCMVVDGKPGTLRPAVTARDPVSGRVLAMYTTEPGVQFYTGNFLDGSIAGRDGVVYGQYHAFALEAQAFPDAVNHPKFPNSILRPGQTYRQTTEYRFGTSEHPPK